MNTLEKSVVSVFRNSHPNVFLGKGVLKYEANLQENIHVEVQF